jgi:hypothetical protein
MQNLTKIRSIALSICGAAALVLTAPALAQHGGGGGGGGHGGAAVGHGSYGGGHYGGYNGGHYGGYSGGHYGGYYGGRYGGYYGGRYGYYGGYGWRGGYWGGGYWWGPWGWGGLGLGLYFATLPYYYSTYWWGGVPYYYADNTYYRWDPGVGQYQTVAPPVGAPNQSGGQAAATSEIIAYPKNGQSEQQQATDRYEAVGQLGYDPTTAGGGTVRRDLTDYNRAQTACLEARGYSVK